MFTSLQSLQNSTVSLPDHTTICVHHIGDIRLSSHIHLKGVLYVPQFKFNLISVSALTNDLKIEVLFLPYHFHIQDIHSKKMIGKGDKISDLYILNVASLDNQIHASVNKASAQIWHNRLGHPSFKTLQPLKDQLQCDFPSSTCNNPCYICPLAK